jgi:hypothetical protein
MLEDIVIGEKLGSGNFGVVSELSVNGVIDTDGFEGV